MRGWHRSWTTCASPRNSRPPSQRHASFCGVWLGLAHDRASSPCPCALHAHRPRQLHLPPASVPSPKAGSRMISYCVASYRPTYSTLLVEDLIRKTSVPFEILLWLNTSDPNFRAHLASLQHAGSPIRIIGHSPENWGMTAYKRLFADAKYDMVVQIDDDVVCISPHIAEVAHN